MLVYLVLLTAVVIIVSADVSMNREGCGKTKACLFKPAGCDPNLDCTIGLIFFVVGPNKLRVEMVATSLIPAVQQQYIAIAFSNDIVMVITVALSYLCRSQGLLPRDLILTGRLQFLQQQRLDDQTTAIGSRSRNRGQHLECFKQVYGIGTNLRTPEEWEAWLASLHGEDFVTECVMSNMGEFAGWEPEIFISYNHGKSNDRIFLNDDEQRTLISNVSSQVIDGRLVCHFTQQIVPQIDRKNGLVGNLSKEYYVFGATGSAQPDEVNAHDTHRGSHFYPIVSSAPVNPSQLAGVQNDQVLDTNVIAASPSPLSSTTSVISSSHSSEAFNSAATLVNLTLFAVVLLIQLL